MAPRLDSLLHTQTQQHRSRNNVFSLQTNDVDKIIHRVHNLLIRNRRAVWKFHNFCNKIFFRPTKTLEQIQLPFHGWLTRPIKNHHSMNKTSILQVKTGAIDPVQDLVEFFISGEKKVWREDWSSHLMLLSGTPKSLQTYSLWDNVRAISKEKHLHPC